MGEVRHPGRGKAGVLAGMGKGTLCRNSETRGGESCPEQESE